MIDPSKTRIGGSKKRTGCITCKARHVKCDEAKPNCNRCIKAGRRCDGYAQESSRKSPDRLTFVNYTAPPSRSVSPFPQIDPRETRALQYFRARTAPELAGWFRTDLWHIFMLRLANYQSSVHHALVALGTVHEAFTTSSADNPEVSEYVDREYGKAIRDVLSLSASTTETSDATEVALATCILFASLESIRGHYQSSLSHLVSGLNVLEEEQRQGRASQSASCIPRELLYALFMRMDSQRMDLGGAGTQQGAMLSVLARPRIPPCFSSTEEARSQFDLIYHHMMQLFYRVEQAISDPRNPPSSEIWKGLLAQRATLEDIRRSWETALNAMVNRRPEWRSESPKAREPGMIVLDMSNVVISMMLAVDMVDPEVEYDNYDDAFDLAVSDVEEYLHITSQTLTPVSASRSPSSTPSISRSPEPVTSRATSKSPKPLLPRLPPAIKPQFTLSIGCVPILYLSATRCRNPTIRHRALALLRKCNRREGLWDSNIAATIAGRLIAIEEANVVRSVNEIQRTLVGHTEETVLKVAAKGARISEEARIKYVDVKFGPDAHGKVMYSMETPKRIAGGSVPSAMDTSGLDDLYEW